MCINLLSFSSNKEIDLIKREIRSDSSREIKLKYTNFLRKRYRENVKIIRDNFARSFVVRTSTIRDGMAAITRQDPLKNY